MSTTRGGEVVSAQIGNMGVIDNLQNKNFYLATGQSFNLKNDGDQSIDLEIQLVGMEDGKFVETTIGLGWNAEIIKTVKKSSLSVTNLKWGY